jgi:hypothetical protein
MSLRHWRTILTIFAFDSPHHCHDATRVADNARTIRLASMKKESQPYFVSRQPRDPRALKILGPFVKWPQAQEMSTAHTCDIQPCAEPKLPPSLLSKGNKSAESKKATPGQKPARNSFVRRILAPNSFTSRILRGKSC